MAQRSQRALRAVEPPGKLPRGEGRWFRAGGTPRGVRRWCGFVPYGHRRRGQSPAPLEEVLRWDYSARWWGNGLPKLRYLADLRGCAATLRLRQGANFYGGLQCGILVNGRKSEPA